MGKIKGWSRIKATNYLPFKDLWVNNLYGSKVALESSLNGYYGIRIYNNKTNPISNPTKRKSVALKDLMFYMKSHPRG